MNKWIKIYFDFFAAFFGLLFLSPVLLIIGLLIKWSDPNLPCLFIQERVGQYGKIFKMVKFRTMTMDHKISSISVLDEHRITKIGKILRRYKLDELPELWNILIGDMSFVGPRPDVPGYADKLHGEARNILEMKPGITGPATLKYKNEEVLLSRFVNPQAYNDDVIFPDKVRINLNYYYNNNILDDLKMIFQTLVGTNFDFNLFQKSVLLYGTGGHSKVVASILEDSEIKIDSIFEDNEEISFMSTYKAVGHYNPKYKSKKPLIISIGDNKIRKKLSEIIVHQYEKAIHRSAIIDKNVQIGFGTVIMQSSLVQSDSIIGHHCIVNSKASIDHDCVLGDFVHIAPNVTLCGNVQVGEGSFIGAGAIIIPNLKIGKWCTIGAGTVVLHDVPDHATVVGNPGRIIKV